ncbi:cytochrome c [Salinisphaera sp. PC39]|uniref:c-type cytochrome n=1 Tax=Salinisphaera sp. PC39 TaxID=1304156 RepID=UPI00333EAAAA
MRKYALGSLLSLAVVGAVALTWALGGFMNVAATYPDPPPLAWLLHSTYTSSVERRSTNIQVPADLGASEQILRGARSYLAMCSGCHTPPGQSPTPVSQGLYPPPPDLVELIPHRSPSEAFWVIENGVRMTGMPAFGPTHEDKELWALVAFLDHIAGASPQTYETLVAEAKRTAPADDGHGHRHSNDAVDDTRSVPGHHDPKSPAAEAHPHEETSAGPSDGHHEKSSPHADSDDGHDHQH